MAKSRGQIRHVREKRFRRNLTGVETKQTTQCQAHLKGLRRLVNLRALAYWHCIHLLSHLVSVDPMILPGNFLPPTRSSSDILCWTPLKHQCSISYLYWLILGEGRSYLHYCRTADRTTSPGWSSKKPAFVSTTTLAFESIFVLSSGFFFFRQFGEHVCGEFVLSDRETNTIPLDLEAVVLGKNSALTTKIVVRHAVVLSRHFSVKLLTGACSMSRLGRVKI